MQLITAVFHDINAVWEGAFRQAGLHWRSPSLHIFDSPVQSACGALDPRQESAIYCAPDETVYLSLHFAIRTEQAAGVDGQIAWAWTVAHEVAHHVQFLRGILQQVQEQMHRACPAPDAPACNMAEANAWSVLRELNTDCLAGVWFHTAYVRNAVTAAGIDHARRAVESTGAEFSGRPQEDWTHGTAAQRRHWFTVGFESGSYDQCLTVFNTAQH